MTPFGEFGLLIDLVVAVLLVAVIAFAIRLNRSLSALKGNRAELEQLIAGFSEATARAEAGIVRLKASAAETADALSQNVVQARELRDDLVFMTSRANELADRLEAAIAAARPDASRSNAGRQNAAQREAGQRDVGQRDGGAVGDERSALARATATAAGMAEGTRADQGRTHEGGVRQATPQQAHLQETGEAGAGDATPVNRGKTKSELLRALQGMR